MLSINIDNVNSAPGTDFNACVVGAGCYVVESGEIKTTTDGITGCTHFPRAYSKLLHPACFTLYLGQLNAGLTLDEVSTNHMSLFTVSNIHDSNHHAQLGSRGMVNVTRRRVGRRYVGTAIHA